jgi:hypothetical protein
MRIHIYIDCLIGKLEKDKLDKLELALVANLSFVNDYGLIRQYTETMLEFDQNECKKLLLPVINSTKKEKEDNISIIKKVIEDYKKEIIIWEKALKTYD